MKFEHQSETIPVLQPLSAGQEISRQNLFAVSNILLVEQDFSFHVKRLHRDVSHVMLSPGSSIKKGKL